MKEKRNVITEASEIVLGIKKVKVRKEAGILFTKLERTMED